MRVIKISASGDLILRQKTALVQQSESYASKVARTNMLRQDKTHSQNLSSGD